jgi:hypothetical protein
MQAEVKVAVNDRDGHTFTIIDNSAFRGNPGWVWEILATFRYNSFYPSGLFLEGFWESFKEVLPINAWPRIFCREIEVSITLSIVIFRSPVFSGRDKAPTLVGKRFDAVIGRSALAAKCEREEGLIGMPRYRDFLRKLQVTNRLSLQRCPYGVASGEKLMKPEGKDRESA